MRPLAPIAPAPLRRSIARALLALAPIALAPLAASCAPEPRPPAIPPSAPHAGAPAAPTEAAPAARAIKRIDAMIPMRDGVKLHTDILIPGGFPGPLPMLFRRTPYHAHVDDALLASPDMQRAEWVERGYIVVIQDIRGRFGSEGQFVMVRPPRDSADPKATDETTDAYDSIDWLVKNVPGTTGRVGMIGTSYDGWLVIMALLDPHPALAAAMPQAAPADAFLGDDFFHNGALRRQPALEYVGLMEAGAGKELTPFSYDRGDTFEWHLRVPLGEIEAKVLGGPRPTWTSFAQHATYDDHWKRRNVLSRFKKPTVPTLHVGGWYDVEDFYGTIANYDAFERLDEGGKNHLLVGPWRHGQWESPVPQRKLGAIDLGVDPNERYLELRARWFGHHLKGEGEADRTEAWLFETGANRWRAFDRFPPANAAPRRLYARAGGRLSLDPPADDGADEYVSDPLNPVPHAARPAGPFWPLENGELAASYGLWRVADQRFASARPDVVSWVTEPLEADVTVAGKVKARLFASTTAKDCDFIVKLIDVFPEGGGELSGYQMMVLGEVLPARFRQGPEVARPVTPGKVDAYEIDMRSCDHRFLKGHRIMVQVQSTWFPLIERNPQSLVDPFKATEADMRKATQRIARSPRFPTHIELPVIPD
ncbi:MAG: CocE/NonD family hydrolase [Polyangiaceae bacterium]|nr:CocE/NonD family hydrolase [Polyangiaceae bacterium]